MPGTIRGTPPGLADVVVWPSKLPVGRRVRPIREALEIVEALDTSGYKVTSIQLGEENEVHLRPVDPE